MRVLLVEHHQELAEAVDQCLRKRGLAVDRVTSLVDAFPLASDWASPARPDSRHAAS